MIHKDGRHYCDVEYEDGRHCRGLAVGKDDLHGDFCDWHSAHHRGYRGRGRWAAPCPGFTEYDSPPPELMVPPVDHGRRDFILTAASTLEFDTIMGLAEDAMKDATNTLERENG
jgi:hypothetical protein